MMNLRIKLSTDLSGCCRRSQLNIESFIQELPLVLREEISLFLHKSMVQKVPIFHGCAESFLSDIVVHLRPQVNMPDELIIDVVRKTRSSHFSTCNFLLECRHHLQRRAWNKHGLWKGNSKRKDGFCAGRSR